MSEICVLLDPGRGCKTTVECWTTIHCTVLYCGRSLSRDDGPTTTSPCTVRRDVNLLFFSDERSCAYSTCKLKLKQKLPLSPYPNSDRCCNPGSSSLKISRRLLYQVDRYLLFREVTVGRQCIVIRSHERALHPFSKRPHRLTPQDLLVGSNMVVSIATHYLRRSLL